MLHAAAPIHLNDGALLGRLLGRRRLNHLLAVNAGNLPDHRAASDCYRGKRCDSAGQKKLLHCVFLDCYRFTNALHGEHRVVPSFLLLV